MSPSADATRTPDGQQSDSQGPGRTPTDPGERYVVREGVVLGVPARRQEARSHRVIDRLVEHVEHTPPGARIRILARSFAVQAVAGALLDAHERGVHVQVVANGKASRQFKAVQRMLPVLGTDRRRQSWLHLSPRSRPTAHQKIWTFSRTGDSRRVVMVGSANISYKSLGQYSDMYTFVDRADVWRTMDRVFRDRAGLAPDTTRRLHVRWGRDQAWFFPGWSLGSDPALRHLATLPARDLELRFAMYAWYGRRGDRIARVVAGKARRGADVTVVATTLGPRSRRILEAAGVRVLDGRLGNGRDVHAKLTLATWTDGDGTRRRLVMTGSDNFGLPSLRRAEALVAIDAARGSAWRDYVRWYDGLVARIADRSR